MMGSSSSVGEVLLWEWVEINSLEGPRKCCLNFKLFSHLLSDCDPMINPSGIPWLVVPLSTSVE